MILALLLACGSPRPADSLPPGDGGTGLPDGGTTSPGDGGSSGDGGGTEPGPFTDLDSRLDYFVGSLATVSWEQEHSATVHVSYSFDEGDWHDSPPFEATAGPHAQLLLGIPFGAEVQWRVQDDLGNTVEGPAFATDPVPEGLPLGEVVQSAPELWLDDGRFLLTSVNGNAGGWVGGDFWTVILDRRGRPVWAVMTGAGRWTLHSQVAASGDHLLIDFNSAWVNLDDGAGSWVQRRTLDEEWDYVPAPGLHHAFHQLPDGTLAWGSQDHGGDEALVLRHPDLDGDETVLWTCSADWPEATLCATNGVYYDADRDSFLLSFYTHDAVVEVDGSTGQTLWWAGGVDGGYTFAEDSRPFWWQHGATWTEDGTLLLSNHVEVDERDDTSLVEYAVDHEAGTLTEVWSFSPGAYAKTNGDAWRLANGNTLHTVGSAGIAYEVSADGEVAWRLEMAGAHLMGRSTWLSDLYPLVAEQGRR